MRAREDLAHYVEDGVVVEGVADFLQLLKEPVEHPSLDRVRRYEVEDETVFALSVPVDPTHPLFEAVGVPGDVVVEEDVAALKVDAFACGFGRNQHLDVSFSELLLRVEACPGFVPRSRFHAAMDAPDGEAPIPETLHQIVEGVLELREEKQALLGTLEKPLILHDPSKLPELLFAPCFLDLLRPFGKLLELPDLLPHLVRIAGEGDCIEHPFDALALSVLELVDFLRIGERRGSYLHELLRARESFLEASCPVLERAAHGVRARSESALVERHEESDRTGPGVVLLLCCAPALALYESSDFVVELVLRSVDGEVHGARNALGKDGQGSPLTVRLTLRKVDHGLLRAPEVEGRALPVHRFADGLDVRVGVPVEQLKEQGEVLRIPLVRCRGEMQDMIGVVP